MLYVINCNLEDNGPGIARKIDEQVSCFSESGLDCSIYVLPYYKDIHSIITKVKIRIPFVSMFTNIHKHWGDRLKKENCLYIRRLGAWDRDAIDYFLRLKENNPSIKIVLEIPTFPYDGELKKSWLNYPLLWKDRYNRKKLFRFIDRIATLTDDKEIFGIPTLKIGNGIDVNKIRIRKAYETNEIHAIAVAKFEWWHGYDRFLEGMKAYYSGNPSRKVVFHLVGNGNEFGRYQKMVAEYGLRDYVIFHDQQTGEALDAIYDQCNFGIASLGCYRKGLNETQELKSREYLAKGLPFVSSVKITDIPDAAKDNIYLQVSNNDSPIDIGSILEFYDRIYSEGAEQVNTRLRQFAKDHFSMEVAMKEVIDFFNEGK